jgi:hypothetical protein
MIGAEPRKISAFCLLSNMQKNPCFVRLGFVLNPPSKPDPRTLQNNRPVILLKGSLPRI